MTTNVKNLLTFNTQFSRWTHVKKLVPLSFPTAIQHLIHRHNWGGGGSQNSDRILEWSRWHDKLMQVTVYQYILMSKRKEHFLFPQSLLYIERRSQQTKVTIRDIYILLFLLAIKCTEVLKPLNSWLWVCPWIYLKS